MSMAFGFLPENIGAYYANMDVNNDGLTPNEMGKELSKKYLGYKRFVPIFNINRISMNDAIDMYYNEHLSNHADLSADQINIVNKQRLLDKRMAAKVNADQAVGTIPGNPFMQGAPNYPVPQIPNLPKNEPAPRFIEPADPFAEGVKKEI